VFHDWKAEHRIRKTLRGLARQRVATILQPGNVLVVENAGPDDEATSIDLRTCHLRGWVEPIADSLPHGTVEGFLSTGVAFSGVAPVYRLTGEGWAAIYRLYPLTGIGVIAGLLVVLIGVLTLR
jgi:hypothetical protein